MSEKRKQQELKVIKILSILIVLVYGIAAVIIALGSSQEETVLGSEINLASPVKQITVETEGESYGLIKEKTVWYSAEEQEVKLSQTKVTAMASAFSNFEPGRIIEDGSKYVEDFGLKTAQYRITIETEAGARTYLVGDYNAILRQYYVMMEGEPSVYLLDKSQVEKCTKTFLDLIADPALSSVESSAITEFKVDGTRDHYRAYKEGEIFRFESEGKTYDSNEYGALNIYYALKNVGYDRCVEYQATEKDLEKYGLKKPEISIEVKTNDGTVYEVNIGQGRDEAYYINSGNAAVVYKITEEEFETLDEKTMISNFVEQ